jgi:hypothetical protein
MPPVTVPPSRFLPFACAIAFALAHTQSPLFYSNQNQYLLHGLAHGGYGHLANDWLALTADPTPHFSLFVDWSYRLGGLAPIQVTFFLLLIAYFLILWRTVVALALIPPTDRALFAFAALFTAAHAAGPRLLSVRLTGVDYPWFLQCGVAGQFALGPGLQPSCFAIWLFASLLAFARGHLCWAAGLAAFAAWFHATYLLPAAMLTLGYQVQVLRVHGGAKACRLGLVALAVVSPAVVYVFMVFRSDDPAAFAESQRILATVRIPHHAVVSRWFDVVAALQIAWVVAGLVRLRKTVLFIPLTVAAGLAVVLTLAQVATGNPTLALLFPWRLSVVLVPLATATIVATSMTRIANANGAGIVSAVVLLALAGSGVAIVWTRTGYAMNDTERGLLQSVRDNSLPNELYLIPAKIPPVGTGRGSMSASFTPPPRPRPGSNLIPVDLQRFRLATGSAIYVDFKSVPYAPDEVIEWERRMRLVEKWYATENWDAAVISQMRFVGITHAVVPKGHVSKIDPLRVERLYEDSAYTLYRLKP